MELTPELVRKHLLRVREATTQVDAHTKHSKTGKAFNVRAHPREIAVTHMGFKFKLRPDSHPEAHIQTLRKIGVRELNLADRIDKMLNDGWYDVKSRANPDGYYTNKKEAAAAKAKAINDYDNAKQKGLAATDLLLNIYNDFPDMVSRRGGFSGKPKNAPSAGYNQLKAKYDEMRATV